jgi:DNA-binding transcriptional ArsR family regulator
VTDPLSKVFAALADPIRRDIVARLATKTERSASWPRRTT